MTTQVDMDTQKKLTSLTFKQTYLYLRGLLEVKLGEAMNNNELDTANEIKSHLEILEMEFHKND